MAKPIQLKLTVQTLSGTFVGEFKSDQKLQDVIDKAFLALDIKPARGEEWRLAYGDKDLDPRTTIEQQKLPDGAVLLLAPAEGGGGCR